MRIIDLLSDSANSNLSACPPKAAFLLPTAAETIFDIESSSSPRLIASFKLTSALSNKQTLILPSAVILIRLQPPQKFEVIEETPIEDDAESVTSAIVNEEPTTTSATSVEVEPIEETEAETEVAEETESNVENTEIPEFELITEADLENTFVEATTGAILQEDIFVEPVTEDLPELDLITSADIEDSFVAGGLTDELETEAAIEIQRLVRGHLGRLKWEREYEAQRINKSLSFLKKLMKQKEYKCFMSWREYVVQNKRIKNLMLRSWGHTLHYRYDYYIYII